MANKRQRLAYKRFKELHPGSTAQRPEKKQVGGKKESVQKAKKRKRADYDTSPEKRRRSEGDSEDIHEKSGQHASEPANGSTTEAHDATEDVKAKPEKVKKRHPLRVPGKKPGDGCFICKSKNHIAKECPEKLAQDRKKMCLVCRQWGHTLKNCPSELSLEAKLCYNCGEKGHRLSECKQPPKNGGTSFAECFLCKQSGHLSKNCPTNPHGIYPKGGSCKTCGEVTHLAKDCPNKAMAKGPGRTKLKIDTNGALASDGGKRTVFRSGDDLDDDFVDGGKEEGVRNIDFGSDPETDVVGAGTVHKQSKASKKPRRSASGAPRLPKTLSTKVGKVVKF